MMIIIYGVLVFILGLCFGSFVNMLVYRTAVKYELIQNPSPAAAGSPFDLKREINKKRSFCDGCGKQLKWYENIPVLSWLIQEGKTRCCKKDLPLSYPIVEILTGLLFVIYFVNMGVYNTPLQMGLGFIIIVCLVFSAVFDYKYMILPDISTGVLVGCAVLLVLFGAIHESPLQYVLSALVGSGFLWFLYFITKGKGMGFGDVKYAIFMGLFLGWKKTIIAFYIAFIVGAIIGLILIANKKAKRNSLIPFGPFLILGTILSWWIGDYIINLINF
jgi:prepilin signal peptidase PulO-like enzyme (type II secretory pathway)